MLRAALILGGAALIRFAVVAPGPSEPVLGDRPSIADSLLAAGDSAVEERERRDRPLAEGETVDPNVASAEELDRLPGVGASKASRIVREREENGPYASVEDLARVSGLGPRSVERLRPHLRVAGGGLAGGRRAVAARAGPVAGEGGRWMARRFRERLWIRTGPRRRSCAPCPGSDRSWPSASSRSGSSGAGSGSWRSSCR